MIRDPKAAGSGIVVAAFLLLLIHGLVSVHVDLSGMFLGLGVIAMGALAIVIAQLSV